MKKTANVNTKFAFMPLLSVIWKYNFGPVFRFSLSNYSLCMSEVGSVVHRTDTLSEEYESYQSKILLMFS